MMGLTITPRWFRCRLTQDFDMKEDNKNQDRIINEGILTLSAKHALVIEILFSSVKIKIIMIRLLIADCIIAKIIN